MPQGHGSLVGPSGYRTRTRNVSGRPDRAGYCQPQWRCDIHESHAGAGDGYTYRVDRIAARMRRLFAHRVLCRTNLAHRDAGSPRGASSRLYCQTTWRNGGMYSRKVVRDASGAS
jgi:hypothetical protein